MWNNGFEKRKKILNVTVMCCFIFITVFLLCINFTVDEPPTEDSDVFEGAFISADGTLLTDFKNLDSDNHRIKHARSLIYPEAYSALLGYNSPKYRLSGLRERYKDFLYDGKLNGAGRDLGLTINHDLQMLCYEILEPYNKNGSIVVVENLTGEIKALVSTKEELALNANSIDDLDFESLFEGALVPSWEQEAVPGSTFKTLSAIALIKNGNSAYTYNDTLGYINCGDAVISNAGSAAHGFLDLNKAMEKSANVYFVSAFKNNDGFYDTLIEVAKKFKLGEEIQLDFCELNSSFDYEPETNFQQVLAVFGQGNNSMLTPIHNAMIFSTIANDGVMMRPYVVSTNIERTWLDKLLNRNEYKKPEVLAENVVNEDLAKQLKEILAYTAESYGLPADAIGKTGTAELNDQGTLFQLWAVASSGKFTVCISMTSDYGYGSSLIEPMKVILDYLENNKIE